MPDNPLTRLLDYGQSPWLDFIDRKLIESGRLVALIRDCSLRGITSNPVIFHKAIAESDDYDDDLATLAPEASNVTEIYESLALADIRNAADRLREVYDSTGGGDGFVSFEVSPHLARDTEGTVADARRLWSAIGRPNVMIKVPGTEEGLPAVSRLLAGGINVNVTLLFSVDRYRAVLRAHSEGLRAALETGLRIERIASVASFFLSRIDSAVDEELEALAENAGTKDVPCLRALRGEAAIASARTAYGAFDEYCSSPAFRELEAEGACRQRLLWASTGTKNPEYSDIKYVEPLVGAHTVSTMPMATLEAFRARGRPERRLPDDVERGAEMLESLERAGIDINAVTERLLEAGIGKFIEPYDATMHALERRVAGGVTPG